MRKGAPHKGHDNLLAVCGAPLHSLVIRPVFPQCMVKPCGNEFTITVTTPSCCGNSSTTSPLLLDREGEDVTKPNVCSTRRCRAFGTWIGRIVKTYDYINRVDIMLPLTVYEGT